MTALSVPILCYHRIADLDSEDRLRSLSVTPQAFRSQMGLLAQLGIQTTNLSSLPTLAGQAYPRRVVLTFDDGYEDCYDVVMPVLRQFGFGATIFLVGDWLAGNGSHQPQPAAMLSAAQVQELGRLGLAFGSHSQTHRRLVELAPQELWGEIAETKDRLESMLAQPVTTFAYPYGLSSPAVRAVVQTAGYTLAVAVNNGTSDIFNLRRIVLTRDVSLLRFLWNLLAWPVHAAAPWRLMRLAH